MHKQQGISSLVKIKKQLSPVCLMLLLCRIFPYKINIQFYFFLYRVDMIHETSEEIFTVSYVLSFKEEYRIAFFLIITLAHVKSGFIGKGTVMDSLYTKARINKKAWRKTKSCNVSFNFFGHAVRRLVGWRHISLGNIFKCYAKEFLSVFCFNVVIGPKAQSYFVVKFPMGQHFGGRFIFNNLIVKHKLFLFKADNPI